MLPRLIRPAAYAWIVQEQQVLLCRLCEPHNAGHWTLPGGGLDFGESPEDGCRREALEETGLEVALEGILAIDSVCLETTPEVAAAESLRLLGFAYPPGSALMHGLRVIYQARVTGGELTTELDGSTDRVEWVPLAEVRRLRIVDLVELALGQWEAERADRSLG